MARQLCEQPSNLNEARGLSWQDRIARLLGNLVQPCVASLPKLKALHEALGGEDFVVIGIAKDSKAALEKFLKKDELPWPNVVDQGEICDKFQIQAFPTTLMIESLCKQPYRVAIDERTRRSARAERRDGGSDKQSNCEAASCTCRRRKGLMPVSATKYTISNQLSHQIDGNVSSISKGIAQSRCRAFTSRY